MSSKPPRLWVLNLDGEHELEAPGNYAPNGRLKSIVEGSRTSLWTGNDALIGDGELVLADSANDARLIGRDHVDCLRITDGVAVPESVSLEQVAAMGGSMWMPTTRAQDVLVKLGTAFEPAPNMQIQREVNSRDFAATVREPLASACFSKHIARTLDSAQALLAGDQPHGWLARRRFGAAGRGRRKIHGGQVRLAEADINWLVASLRFGPLVIEPFVQITCEYTRSGHVSRSGEVTIAQPCFQATSDSGAWQRTELAGAGGVSNLDDAALAGAMEVAGLALAQTGYFGPFGIDAFRYRDPDRTGQTLLNPLSEINARYTMDWSLGMGPNRATHPDETSQS